MKKNTCNTNKDIWNCMAFFYDKLSASIFIHLKNQNCHSKDNENWTTETQDYSAQKDLHKNVNKLW